MRPLSASVAFTLLIGFVLAHSAVGFSAQTSDKLTQSNSCIKAGAAPVLTDREQKDYRSLKSELGAALPNHIPTAAEDRLLRAVVTGTTAGGAIALVKKILRTIWHMQRFGVRTAPLTRSSSGGSWSIMMPRSWLLPPDLIFARRV